MRRLAFADFKLLLALFESIGDAGLGTSGGALRRGDDGSGLSCALRIALVAPEIVRMNAMFELGPARESVLVMKR